MKSFLFEMLMKPYKLTGICFIVWLLVFIVGCSANNSTTVDFQNVAVSNQNANVPSMSKVNRLTPNLNGRVYKSKTLILNGEISKKLKRKATYPSLANGDPQVADR
ncbi:MAG: hypothetical protein M3R14_16760 [Acidobacteriota bacterium]|nr:hypothetical protein [Acidobacteriota bacterium]